MSDIDISSWSLVRRAAAGSPSDRAHFAARYAPVIRAYFSARWHLPHAHERVQDASQDVFIECFKESGVLTSADRSYGDGGFRAFLYGVARRVGANMDRVTGRRREVGTESSFDDEVASPDSGPTGAFDRSWARLVAREAGELARSRCQGHPGRMAGLEALQMQFYEGLQPRDIAARRGVAVGSVYEALRQARRDFRAAFLEVMAAYNPHCTEAELRQRCIDLVARL